MNHPEVDELLDLVRGESVDEDVRRHVDRCAQCAGDVERTVRLDAAAGLIGRDPDPDGLVAPDPSVWDRIQAEIDSDGPGSVARSTGASRSVPVVAAAAAIVGVVLGGVGGYVLGDRDPSPRDRPAVQARTPVADGTLTPVGQDVVSGDMTVGRRDGARSLTITFSQTLSGPGYLEAWLLDPLTNEMLGLGVLGAGGGTVTVPLEADLTRFTTVDVSREPFDGDPAHSSDSIARGVLRQP